jgi:hypothetical protein
LRDDVAHEELPVILVGDKDDIDGWRWVRYVFN